MANESQKHILGKKYLYDIFHEGAVVLINTGRRCPLCGRPLLIKEVVRERILEKKLGPKKPDLTVRFKSGKIMACEVIYTSAPDKKKLDFLRKYMDYVLLYYVKKSWKRSRDYSLFYNASLSCDHRPWGEVHLFSGSCWRCKKNITVGLLGSTYPWRRMTDKGQYFSIDNRCTFPNISMLSEESAAIEFYLHPYPTILPCGFVDAVNKKCALQITLDHTRYGNYYLMNHCSYCGAKIGNYWITSLEHDDFVYKGTVIVDFHTQSCERDGFRFFKPPRLFEDPFFIEPSHENMVILNT